MRVPCGVRVRCEREGVEVSLDGKPRALDGWEH